MPDPQTSDADLPQNFIDWYIDPLKRSVDVDTAFGAMPLHLKHEDDFDWRIHFRPGGFAGQAAIMQLSQLTELKFIMLEKGRYDGTPLALGIASTDWDETNKGYNLQISLNSAALAAYLATLDATNTGFPTGGFDCTTAAAKAAGTTTTTTPTTGGGSTTTTAPGTPAPSTLTDYEFMAEFRWVQNGKQMRSQTFSIFVARDLITSTVSAVIIAPPALPTDWRFFCNMNDEGTPFTGQVFGYVKAPLQLEVLGVQVALQQIDPAQGFRIQLTDNTGTPLGGGNQYFGDFPANTAFATLLFGQVLPMNQGDEVRAKILNYAGNTAAGLVVNLICRQYLTNSPAGPSGPPGITSVHATALPAGSQPTASIVGQVLNLGLPQGAKGDDGASIANVVIHQLAVGAQPTAALSNNDTTLTLGLPAPQPGAPGNPGQGVTGAQVQALAAGQPPTATITNGTLFLGIPAGAQGVPGPTGFDTVSATTVAPNAPATATLANRNLAFGIPKGDTGSYLHTATTDSVLYSPGNNTVLNCTFTGVGKPALVLISFENSDDQTGNQSGITFKVVRSDGRVIFSGDSSIAHVGNTYPYSFMAIDSQTATTPMTYTLSVHGYSGVGYSANEVSGTARNPTLAILEIVN